MRALEIPLADLAGLLESAPDLEPVEPHPDLVASKQPSAADVVRAALEIGWLPEAPFLRPAVPIRQEDLGPMRHCPVTGLVDCDCGSCEDDEMAEGVAQAWRDGGSDDGEAE